MSLFQRGRGSGNRRGRDGGGDRDGAAPPIRRARTDAPTRTARETEPTDGPLPTEDKSTWSREHGNHKWKAVPTPIAKQSAIFKFYQCFESRTPASREHRYRWSCLIGACELFGDDGNPPIKDDKNHKKHFQQMLTKSAKNDKNAMSTEAHRIIARGLGSEGDDGGAAAPSATPVLAGGGTEQHKREVNMSKAQLLADCPTIKLEALRSNAAL